MPRCLVVWAVVCNLPVGIRRHVILVYSANRSFLIFDEKIDFKLGSCMPLTAGKTSLKEWDLK